MVDPTERTPQAKARSELFHCGESSGGSIGRITLRKAVFVNRTRPQLPAECKVSEQAELMMRLCEKIVLEHGGKAVVVDGRPGFRIRMQEPAF